MLPETEACTISDISVLYKYNFFLGRYLKKILSGLLCMCVVVWLFVELRMRFYNCGGSVCLSVLWVQQQYGLGCCLVCFIASLLQQVVD